tara:strand:- start:3 stop:230 length:228 start_codon:yes stop_codon:yes gene_type:complete
MPIAGISQGLGFGGGTTATINGIPHVAGGFNIDVRDTKLNILARSGDATGVIAFGTDTNNLYVFDGTAWQIYYNS